MTEDGERNRILEGLESDTCPIADCGVSVPRGYFLCPAHWREVPDLLKSETRQAVRGPWHRWLESAVACVQAVEASAGESANR